MADVQEAKPEEEVVAEHEPLHGAGDRAEIPR